MGYISQLLSSTKQWWLELAGSFLLVFIGTGALVTLNLNSQATTPVFMLVSLVAFALPFGWLVYVLSSRTSGYFNPILSLWLWLTGQINVSQFISVFLAQFAGALLASISVALLYGPTAVELGLGAVYPNSAMGVWASAVAEALGTVILLLSFIKVSQTQVSEVKKATMLGLGMAISLLLSMGLSGGAINPVRALAPQMAAANYTGWWVYWVGPFVAVLAVWLWRSTTDTQVDEVAKESGKSTSTASQTVSPDSQPKTPTPPPIIVPPKPAIAPTNPVVVEGPAQPAPAKPADVEVKNQSAATSQAEPAKRQPLKPSFIMDDDRLETETASQIVVKTDEKPTVEAKSDPNVESPQDNKEQAPKERQPLPKPTSVTFVNFDHPVDIDVSDDK